MKSNSQSCPVVPPSSSMTSSTSKINSTKTVLRNLNNFCVTMHHNLNRSLWHHQTVWICNSRSINYRNNDNWMIWRIKLISIVGRSINWRRLISWQRNTWKRLKRRRENWQREMHNCKRKIMIWNKIWHSWRRRLNSTRVKEFRISVSCWTKPCDCNVMEN